MPPMALAATRPGEEPPVEDPVGARRHPLPQLGLGWPVDPRDQADARAIADDMSSVEPPIGSTDRDVETELFKRLPGDEEARERLVGMFLPLAEYLARRFDRRGEPLEDLVQVASVGLLNAIDRFDVEREVQFSTYAAVTIIGELKRHFRDKGWAIRVPRRLQEVGPTREHRPARALAGARALADRGGDRRAVRGVTRRDPRCDGGGAGVLDDIARLAGRGGGRGADRRARR